MFLKLCGSCKLRLPFVSVSFGRLGRSRMSLTENDEDRGILMDSSLINDVSFDRFDLENNEQLFRSAFVYIYELKPG